MRGLRGRCCCNVLGLAAESRPRAGDRGGVFALDPGSGRRMFRAQKCDSQAPVNRIPLTKIEGVTNLRQLSSTQWRIA